MNWQINNITYSTYIDVTSFYTLTECQALTQIKFHTFNPLWWTEFNVIRTFWMCYIVDIIYINGHEIFSWNYRLMTSIVFGNSICWPVNSYTYSKANWWLAFILRSLSLINIFILEIIQVNKLPLEYKHIHIHFNAYSNQIKNK